MDRRTAILFGDAVRAREHLVYERGEGIYEAAGVDRRVRLLRRLVLRFNVSLRALEISGRAAWSAVVMAALAAIGMLFFGESVSIAKVSGISAIIAGTVALSLAGVE